MTDIVERLRCWVIATDAVPASDLMDEAADEIERLRIGAVEGRETVRDGVVPTVTWFDQKIAEECRIAQAEAARLQLTDEEQAAILTAADLLICSKPGSVLRKLLERTK